MSAYEYDIFFSYKRNSRNQFWISQVSGLVKQWLREEGVDSAQVFVDVESIETGDHWPTRLSEALAKSKCMIAIWSAPYFQSSWCLSEWQTFRKREAIIGTKLIVPIVFHDGEHFPIEAKETQSHDFKRYAFTLPAFWQTPTAVELEGEIKQICAIAAAIVHGCPDFDESWPVADVNEGQPPKHTPLIRL